MPECLKAIPTAEDRSDIAKRLEGLVGSTVCLSSELLLGISIRGELSYDTRTGYCVDVIDAVTMHSAHAYFAAEQVLEVTEDLTPCIRMASTAS